MAKIISRIILLLFVPTLSGCNLQRDMLYYPGTSLPSLASLAANNIQFWPSDSGSGDYRGFINILQADNIRGTIIIFHGNAGTAADRVYYVKTLTHLGYRVLLAEYPGYGGRKGEPGEEPFVRDAKETLRLAFEKFGGPIFILGESLGCGVAAAAAKDSLVKIDGIILITPWDTLQSVAREKVTWLPVRLFLRDKYDTIGNLKEYQGKLAVVGAEQDVVIPIHHAQTLYKALSRGQGARTMYTIKGAGHNDWPGIVDQAWWQALMDFIQG